MSDSPQYPAAVRLRKCAAFHRISFTPAPVKPRHDGWTPERQREFIDRLCVTGCVALSARAVGKTPQTAYRLRDHEGAASFRAAWDRALADGRSYQRDIAFERAIDGQTVPVFWKGQQAGKYKRHDDRLPSLSSRP